jgi:hypothetical protein
VGVIRLKASIAQLGERQTEDLKVLGSIPSRGSLCIPFDLYAMCLVSYVCLQLCQLEGSHTGLSNGLK